MRIRTPRRVRNSGGRTSGRRRRRGYCADGPRGMHRGGGDRANGKRQQISGKGAGNSRQSTVLRTIMRSGMARRAPEVTPAPLGMTSPSWTARPGEKCRPASMRTPRRNMERPALVATQESLHSGCRGARTSACRVESQFDASAGPRQRASAGVPTRQARVLAPHYAGGPGSRSGVEAKGPRRRRSAAPLQHNENRILVMGRITGTNRPTVEADIPEITATGPVRFAA